MLGLPSTEATDNLITMKFKVGWVASGFDQVGEHESGYLPVVDGAVRRIFFAIVARRNLDVRHGDTIMEILHASLNKIIGIKSTPFHATKDMNVKQEHCDPLRG